MRVAGGVAIVALVIVGSCARSQDATPHRETLRELYTPKFARIPDRPTVSETLRQLRADWNSEPGARFRSDLRSPQALLALLGAAVILAVGFDWKRPASSGNVDLLLLYATGLLFFDVMRFFDVLNRPAYVALMDWVFAAVFVSSAMLALRALRRCAKPLTEKWQPRLKTPGLTVLAVVLLAIDLSVLFQKPPDDAGWFVNLGAQRLRERGRLPYGDPILTGTPAAAYGPLLYVAHIPFQLIVAPNVLNPTASSRPILGPESTYYLPPTLATTLCTAAFHLLGVAALWFAARRLAGTHVAMGLVCLYCGSLAVVGIGGDDYSVAGITFVSHIAPASAVLLAFAALDKPTWSGALLATSAGLGFYPAFMAPAWLGYYWGDRTARVRFIAAFGLGCGAIVIGVLLLSQPTGEYGRIGTIMRDTFGHHTDPSGYGSSPFGFWGQRGGVRGALSTPLVGQSGLTTPVWLSFAALIVVTFFLVRGRSPVELALASGAVAIGATLVKPHATGTYMAWYYGLLLIGFLVRRDLPPEGGSHKT
jgi:hypothetical protein